MKLFNKYGSLMTDAVAAMKLEVLTRRLHLFTLIVFENMSLEDVVNKLEVTPHIVNRDLKEVLKSYWFIKRKAFALKQERKNEAAADWDKAHSELFEKYGLQSGKNGIYYADRIKYNPELLAEYKENFYKIHLHMLTELAQRIVY